MNIPRLIIAAPMSGSGKTTLTAGLIAAFVHSGLRVAPFKIGPDYIDPTYHALAAGQPSHNLDPWLIPPDRVAASFARRAQHADIAILEGVMGLFDGYSGRDDTGSTAHIARLLNAPVLLVLDARAMARSAAAIVRGFRDFDPQVTIAGVLLNRVGSDRHVTMLKDAIETETQIPVLGYLGRDESLSLPERHLGLVPTAEPGNWEQWIETLRTKVEATLDIDQILNIAGNAPPLPDDTHTWFAPAHDAHAVIAVARDPAFNFIYEDNLDLLRAAGAEIVFFSPMYDSGLPAGIQAVYLCGGFPEIYAEPLSANTAMRAALQTAHARNLPIYAECGGLMYLTEAISDLNGHAWPMVGVLPGQSTMTPKLTMGYRSFMALQNSWLWRAGETMRGHEFHYSAWQHPKQAVPHLYEFLQDASHTETRLEGVCINNLIASYTHIHFLSQPELASRFVQAASLQT